MARVFRPVSLQTAQDRISLLVRNERLAMYRYGPDGLPGFTALYALGYLQLLRTQETVPALWVGSDDINGVPFTLESQAAPGGGRIVPVETTARRSSQTVGFRQECRWLDPEGRTLLIDQRTVRVLPGPGEGSILDLSLRLQAPETGPAIFGRTGFGPLALRVASALTPVGSGQARNSQGDYGLEQMDGRSAGWCACVGVVNGVTVGIALLDHPANYRHPTPWVCRTDGLISPAPFAWAGLRLEPGQALTLNYRLHVYEGYVDAGWADARLEDFARELRPSD